MSEKHEIEVRVLSLAPRPYQLFFPAFSYYADGMRLPRIVDALRSQEGHFNEEQYLKEPDPKKRLEMARAYYQTAQNAWVAVYDRAIGVLGDLPDRARVVFDTKLQESSARQQTVSSGYDIEDRAKKLTVYAEPAQALHSLKEVSLFLHILGESLSQEVREEMMSTSWEMFLKQFGLPENISDSTQETLDWLKQKILDQEVVVFSLADAKTPEDEAQIRQILQSISAPFVLSPHPTSNKNQLLIFPDFIAPDQTGEDFISILAHERGHEEINQIDGQPTTPEELIFSEFFAYLEEWRVFIGMTREEVVLLSNNDRRDGFIVADYLRNTELATTVPGLDQELRTDFNTALNALYRAYQHGLFGVHQTRIEQELQRLRALTDPVLTETEIQERLAQLKIVTQSVLPENMPEWVLRRKSGDN